RLTLTQRVRREKDQSLVTSAATSDCAGSWSQYASEIQRPLVGADVRRLTLTQRVRREKDQSLVTSAATSDCPRSWSQYASEIRRPLVGADVRRLTLTQRVRRERDQSLVTSAATLGWVRGENDMECRMPHIKGTSAFRCFALWFVLFVGLALFPTCL